MNDLSPTAQAFHKHTNETGGYLAMDLENIEDPNGQDQIVELAVVNENGCVEAHLFFKPEGACLPQQVRPGLPSHLLQHCRTFSESKPLIQELVRRRDLVFYNAQRDLQLLGDSVNTAASFNCAMQRAAPIGGKWSPKHHSYQWLKLSRALEIAGLPKPKGQFHRAIPDAQACMSLWLWLEERDRKVCGDHHPEFLARLF